MSQCDDILLHLQKHGRITDDQARDLYGCKRLASRINDLRKLGHPIITDIREGENRNGRTVQWAEYYMVKEGASAKESS